MFQTNKYPTSNVLYGRNNYPLVRQTLLGAITTYNLNLHSNRKWA